MSPDIVLALVTFCIVSSVTPGPNNMMLLSSGGTFGFGRTVPHILGISFGCVVMVLLLGIGLASVIARAPWLYTGLHIVSIAYLLYLSWRIATSVGVGATSARTKPLGMIEAAAFQWVNPKAWAMCLGIATGFTRPGHLYVDVPVAAVVLAMTGLPCIMLWAGGGTMMRRLLTRPGALRVFNIGMASLLVASLVPGVIELAQRI
ncbi:MULTISPECIES: LysE family translocator [unclassified Sphingomonas]|uniref:LysE family translocator n=1 Tax=unclassified Sphingomonas TaxID=196159 RepID=UPI0006F9336A|nr:MULTISPECIES: LysE family translocator [unclassified Sphingomonas]KQX19423.1 lysine transporter LysE [Sphingomonas sp. Root1294]KQY65624.1 lysine transporter LysE [Sphingomonas sp. Root50]KRB95073.1 lysine transporter LysE [Sphingomonas sp. Root720]